MSGHSKWNNIKRTKEKADNAKGKIFTKIGRELAVIVKSGGPDPTTNAKLKDAIAKAKQQNMPNDTIMRSIKKASGELGNINYEEIVYEGYGVGGSAVIVKCLTDNKNRTAGDVRHAFDKYNGSLGATGCVSYLFKNKGIIIVEKQETTDADEVMMLALDLGAVDVNEEEDIIQIETNPEDVTEIAEKLEQNNLVILSSEATLIPDMYTTLEKSKEETFKKMIEKLEDSDDVQEVYHNVDNADVE